MKLAFLFGTMSRGGAERVIASLANTYCAQGDEVSIITMDNSPSGYPLDERVNHIRLNLAGKSKNKLQALVRNGKVLAALRKQVIAGGYDAVVTFQLRQAVLLQYAFPFGRKFKIITSERANPHERKLGKLEKLQFDRMLPKVDGFIFQTERVSKCYHPRLQKIGAVIHNGVFPEILPEKVPEFDSRRHTDIVAVGRLAKQKGYDVMLRAFAEFGKTYPKHRLHIYGEGPLQRELEQLARELGLEEKVMFHGSVPNVMHQAADAGMFLLASRFEGMPNALMEAMACGLPCVAADCDFGPGELIEHGENGLLVPVEDAAALADAMARLAAEEPLRRKLSENAANIRVSHHGAEIARQYRAYIAAVVAGEMG